MEKINETSLKSIRTLTEHTNAVKSLVVLPNNMFASASDDSSIRIWDQTVFKCVHILNDHKESVSSLVAFQNEKLISISDDKTMIVWDILSSFSMLSTIQTPKALLSIVLFSND